MIKKLTILLAAVALAAFGLAACGSDDSADTTDEATTEAMTAETTDTTTEQTVRGPGGTVTIEADPGGALAYTETELSTKPGENTIEFTNPASVTHDVVIEDADGNEIARTELIEGSTTSTTADLAKGTYTFYCSVTGHRAAGMEGTLNVKK